MLGIRGTIMAASAVVTVFLVKYLGTEGFGSYSAASNIYAVFLPFILFGMGNVITRDVARNTEDAWKYFSTALYAGLILTAIGTALLYYFCAAFGFSPLVRKAAVILALGLFPNFIIQISESLFVGLQKVRNFALANFICTLAEVVLIVACLLLGYRVISIVTVLVLRRYLFAGAVILMIRRLVGFGSLRPDFQFASGLMRVSAVFALAGVMAGVLFEIDVLFLSRLSGLRETGLYAAAYKLVGLWNSVITCFISVFYPIAARYHKAEPEKFRDLCRLMLRGVLVLVFLSILFTLALSRELVLTLFSAEYEESVAILNTLVFLLVPLCATPMLGLILAASDKQKLDLVAITTAAVLSFGLHYGLVKRFGYYGSAGASLLTFSIIQALQLYFVNRHVFPIEFFKNIFKPACVFVLTLALLPVFRDWAWYFRTGACLAVYAGLVFAFGLLRRKEVELFLSPAMD
jgi:O-antigen/teichoic acid export membrane protein